MELLPLMNSSRTFISSSDLMFRLGSKTRELFPRLAGFSFQDLFILALDGKLYNVITTCSRRSDTFALLPVSVAAW